MRFVCDSCQAQYMISDDKLGAKGAKVRCKKCGHVILVRRPEVVPLPRPVSSEPAPAAAGQAREGQDGQDEEKKHLTAAEILEGVKDDEIGAVFDQALTESPDGPNLGDGAPFPNQMPANEPPVPTEAAAPAAAPVPTYEWFVAIEDKQVGPIVQEKVKQLWDSGEIGPDSLCWRVGLADWKPLSEMTELSSLLAPRPAKPVIIAPAPATSVAGSVESVFAAASRPERAQVPAASAADPAPENAGWRPSAANALASLLQEEMKALRKPVPVVPQAVEAPQPSRPAAQTSPLMQPPAFDAPIGVAPIRFGSYSEPRSHKGVIIAAVAGGLVVAAAVVVTFYFARIQLPTAQLVVAAPQKAPTPEPAKAPTAAVSPPAAATSSPPAVPGAKAADQKTETTGAAKTESPAATANTEPERTSGGRRERSRHRSRSPSSSEQAGQPERTERPTVARAVEPPTEASDDEFQKTFGGGGGGERAPASRSERRSVYVPPAPGSASSDLPDTLGQSDIMSVVVQNKPSIVNCVAEQKKRDPSLSGRLVMRWQIHTNGRTSNVSCQSDEFRGTPLASCLAGLIKTWTFPKHRIQGEPINFPFTF